MLGCRSLSCSRPYSTKALAKEKWAGKAEANLKAAAANPQKYCYVDGDTKEYDGYEGMWALSATRAEDKGAPLVLDKDKTKLLKGSARIYAGCLVNAKVEFWMQDNDFGKAARCTLLGVQFAKDAPAFGSGNSVASEEDFEDLSAEDEEATTDDFL